MSARSVATISPRQISNALKGSWHMLWPKTSCAVVVHGPDISCFGTCFIAYSGRAGRPCRLWLTRLQVVTD